MIERLVDLLANELDIDPVELRRKNLIPPFEDGHDVATGVTYDSGDYEGILALALDTAGYAELRKEQAELRDKGRYMGIGVSTYAEICGLGPSQVAGAVGFPGRSMGERGGPLPSYGQGQRIHGDLSARPG